MDSTNNNWESRWRQTLAGLPNDLWLTDLDGTAWQDILVRLNEQFGPVNEVSGEKKWLEYDRAYKAGTMTNGQHLVAEYQDLLAVKSLDELIAWVKDEKNVPLTPGLPDFVGLLAGCGVGIVAVSNGAREIAQPKLDHHQLPFRLMSNWFEGTELKFVHDEHVGIDKGMLAAKAAEWGYRIRGFSGDAKGDMAGAEVTARLGGLVLACGHGALSHWCEKNLALNQWVEYSDFRQVLRAVQSRLAGF